MRAYSVKHTSKVEKNPSTKSWWMAPARDLFFIYLLLFMHLNQRFSIPVSVPPTLHVLGVSHLSHS